MDGSVGMFVSCFYKNTTIKVGDLLGFSKRLERWCQLDAILVRVKNATENIQQEVTAISEQLSYLLPDDDVLVNSCLWLQPPPIVVDTIRIFFRQHCIYFFLLGRLMKVQESFSICLMLLS